MSYYVTFCVVFTFYNVRVHNYISTRFTRMREWHYNSGKFRTFEPSKVACTVLNTIFQHMEHSLRLTAG